MLILCQNWLPWLKSQARVSNRLSVKKNHRFPKFLAPALPLARGVWGDRRCVRKGGSTAVWSENGGRARHPQRGSRSGSAGGHWWCLLSYVSITLGRMSSLHFGSPQCVQRRSELVVIPGPIEMTMACGHRKREVRIVSVTRKDQITRNRKTPPHLRNGGPTTQPRPNSATAATHRGRKNMHNCLRRFR